MCWKAAMSSCTDRAPNWRAISRSRLLILGCRRQRPARMRKKPRRSGGVELDGRESPKARVTQTPRGGKSGLRRNSLVGLCRLAQHVTAAPHRLDVVLAGGGVGEFLAQLADEHVDDFELRLVHAAVEMVEEHLLGERGPFTQGEQLEHLVFLARQVHALTADFHRLGVEIDD